MAKKLKTYETSLGFFDLAIAAPSMKAALEAWGADSNLFHQGAAKQSEDPDVVAATMTEPGVMLKRPVGSNGPFKEHAELPTNLGDATARPSKTARKPPGRKPNKTSYRCPWKISLISSSFLSAAVARTPLLVRAKKGAISSQRSLI